jgi:anaerobic selenocysteine-containing dehydrogenase
MAARKAVLHAQICPGTDIVLALGMIHVIIKDQLYDSEFIDKYCIGFNRLKIHVKDYTLEKVSGITRIPPDQIENIARSYALAERAVIQWGNAVEHGINSFGTARAISILRAITGKLDKTGCDIQPLYPVTGAGTADIILSDRITPDIWEKRLCRNKPMLPWFRRVLPADIIHSLNTADPYRISCLYIMGANPLMTFSNVKNAEKALKKADFIAVSDRFMTLTAHFADIILPPATFLEYDSIIAPPYYSYAGIQCKAVDTKGTLSDYDITTRLAEKLGLGDDFFPDITDFFNLVLEPSNLTFEKFKKLGTLQGKRKEKKYLDKGFQTPSGKVEIYSTQLKDNGFSPLPSYMEDNELSGQYPLLLTSGKSGFFRHADNRQLPSLRKAHPEPVVKINPVTAQSFHIKHNDKVCIETVNGAIIQKADITENVMPGVVFADFGWWFPEDEKKYETWKNSNLNILTSDSPPFSPETGSVNFRGIACRIKGIHGYRPEEFNRPTP